MYLVDHVLIAYPTLVWSCLVRNLHGPCQFLMVYRDLFMKSIAVPRQIPSGDSMPSLPIQMPHTKLKCKYPRREQLLLLLLLLPSFSSFILISCTIIPPFCTPQLHQPLRPDLVPAPQQRRGVHIQRRVHLGIRQQPIANRPHRLQDTIRGRPRVLEQVEANLARVEMDVGMDDGREEADGGWGVWVCWWDDYCEEPSAFYRRRRKNQRKRQLPGASGGGEGRGGRI